MVKADKARAVEDLLIRMAQSNQLRSKVSEKQLIDLLGQMNQQDSNTNSTRIVVKYSVIIMLKQANEVFFFCGGNSTIVDNMMTLMMIMIYNRYNAMSLMNFFYIL